jgi:N-acetylmuramic acid 6-phosphate etherase
MLTEQPNDRTLTLDQLTTAQVLALMNDEDAKVHQAVRATLPDIEQAVEAIAAAFQRGGRLIYTGAGTSGRLGVLDAVECVPTFSSAPGQVLGIIAGGAKAITQAVEGAEDDAQAGANDLCAVEVNINDVVVGVAASGRTPYVIGALNYARSIGVTTVAVSCNVPAPVLDAADIKIGVPVGPEILTGSTRLKSGTAQKLVLNMLSTGAFVKIGKVYGNLMVDVQVTNAKLADRAKRIVMQVSGADEATAGHLLIEAGNSAKLAIVMHVCKVDSAAARQLLSAANGRLRTVLEIPPSPLTPLPHGEGDSKPLTDR